MAVYALPDEPRPGALQSAVTDPMWPLLATMLVGAWFGLAWFAFNGLALGSATRPRELGLIALALGGKALVIVSMVAALQAGWIDKSVLPYLYLVATGVLLAATYALYLLQSRSFELYTHFGGEAKNGVVIVMLGMAVLRPAVAPLFGEGFLELVLR